MYICIIRIHENEWFLKESQFCFHLKNSSHIHPGWHWGGVSNERIFSFGWTIPLRIFWNPFNAKILTKAAVKEDNCWCAILQQDILSFWDRANLNTSKMKHLLNKKHYAVLYKQEPLTNMLIRYMKNSNLSIWACSWTTGVREWATVSPCCEGIDLFFKGFGDLTSESSP